MDTVNGFDKSAISEVARKLYNKQALGLALTEAQLKAADNNCRAWFYKYVVQRLLEQIDAVDREIKGIVAQQELKSVGRDAQEPPLFVEHRR